MPLLSQNFAARLVASLPMVRPSPTKTEAPQIAAKTKSMCHWILRRPPGVIIEKPWVVGTDREMPAHCGLRPMPSESAPMIGGCWPTNTLPQNPPARQTEETRTGARGHSSTPYRRSPVEPKTTRRGPNLSEHMGNADGPCAPCGSMRLWGHMLAACETFPLGGALKLKPCTLDRAVEVVSKI